MLCLPFHAIASWVKVQVFHDCINYLDELLVISPPTSIVHLLIAHWLLGIVGTSSAPFSILQQPFKIVLIVVL